jgi:hypothetical protein
MTIAVVAAAMVAMTQAIPVTPMVFAARGVWLVVTAIVIRPLVPRIAQPEILPAFPLAPIAPDYPATTDSVPATFLKWPGSKIYEPVFQGSAFDFGAGGNCNRTHIP